MANKISLNPTSYHGAGAINEIATEIKAHGFKKAFVASDPDLVKFGVTGKVTDILDKENIPWELYSNIKPNPTIENVQTGVEASRTAVLMLLLRLVVDPVCIHLRQLVLSLQTQNLKMLLAWKVLLQLKTNLSQLSQLRLQQVLQQKLQSTM